MSSVKASGTQAASIGVEHTLYETVAGDAPATYQFWADLANEVNGDVVELRVYAKVKAGGTQRLAVLATYPNIQGEPIVYTDELTVGFAEAGSLKVTLKQTDGGGRNFDWGLVGGAAVPEIG